MGNNKLPLSIAVITRDEQGRIRGCLESASAAGDIVVLDSGSTDNTTDIARGMGARVFVEEWKGYGEQKNSAIAKCINRWVLVLDSDERVPGEAWGAIEKAIKEPGGASAFSLRRKNFFRGRWMKRSGEWPDRQVRLVDRQKGSYRSSVHEQWCTEGETVGLEASIEHHSHEDFSGWIRKMDEYSTLSALEMKKAGRRPGPLSPFAHGAGMFLRTYILKAGFLDGLDGLAVCLVKACGSFFKYAKLIEINRREGGP